MAETIINFQAKKQRDIQHTSERILRHDKQNHSSSKVKWIGLSVISVKQHSSKLTASGGKITVSYQLIGKIAAFYILITCYQIKPVNLDLKYVILTDPPTSNRLGPKYFASENMLDCIK